MTTTSSAVVLWVSLLGLLGPRSGLVTALPRFSWDTLNTFAHCSNHTGPLSDHALAAFGHHRFVVVEKDQCFSCAPANHSAEQKMYAASRQLKAAIPGVETYVYTAVDVARRMYDGLLWFDSHPEAELHNDTGGLVTHDTTWCPRCAAFDYTDTLGPTPARWNAVVLDAIASGGMDGAFIDGIDSAATLTGPGGLLAAVPPPKQHQWMLALNATLATLRRSVGGGAVLIQNCHAGWDRSGDARTQLGVGGKIDSKLSFGPKSLWEDMVLFASTSPRVAALYQNFGDAGHAGYAVSLAAFLVSMGPNAYWSFTQTDGVAGWGCADWAAKNGHEADLSRPLGKPATSAMQCRDDGSGGSDILDDNLDAGAGRVCTRRFGSGTCVYMRVGVGATPATTASCVWWSDGAVVGDAFTCASATARSAACIIGDQPNGTAGKTAAPPPPPDGCPDSARSVRPGAVVLGWDWPNATGSPRWSSGYCWQQLSHVAWSSVGLDAAGAVAPASGGGWDDAAALTQEARQWGVTTLLTIAAGPALSANVTALLADPTAAAAAVENIAALVAKVGAGGVVMDIEHVRPSSAERDFYGPFVLAVAARMAAAGLEMFTCIAWRPGILDLDYAELAQRSRLVLMAYGMHSAGSSHAGPSSLLLGKADPDPTLGVGIETGVPEFLRIPGVPATRLVLGVPFSGWEWPVASLSAPAGAPTTGMGTQTRFEQLQARFAAPGAAFALHWHNATQNPWYSYVGADGVPRQGWFDNGRSLAAKWRYANHVNLLGTAIWGLPWGVGSRSGELWVALADAYGD